MTDRDGEGVGCMARLRRGGEPEHRLDHALDLRLVGVAVAADHLLDPVRRVFSGREPGARAGDEHGASGLPDGERGAGVDADERLLEGDRLRPVLLYHLLHAVEDRPQPQLQRGIGSRSPDAMRNGPEAPVAFLDDSVPASSRARIDAENLHVGRVGALPDGAAQRAGPSRCYLDRVRKGWFALLAVAAALTLPALATGSTVERVRISGPTAAFPRGVSLQLTSPPAYARGSARGTWLGPRYQATRNPSAGGRASIRWGVSFVTSAAKVKSVALGAPTHGWDLDKKDWIGVPHVVGRRVVGTIQGYYVITRAPAPGDAAYQAVLAFPVAPKAYSIVRFDLTTPSTDSAGAAGSFLVGGIDLPSVWNRGQAFWALAGVRLLGNLPPSQVSLTGAGRTLRGSVADAFRNPVLHVVVSLERRSAGGWRQVTKTKTSSKGSFSIRIGRHGSYRAVASFRGKRITSRAVSA